MTTPSFIREQPDGVLISVKVRPRASANELGPALGSELRVRVTAPPVDAAANEALVRLLAEVLDLPRNRVELARGHTSGHKVVKIYGISAAAAAARLAQVQREC